MAADRGVERDLGGGVVGWRVLVQALMRAMVIEVTHVLIENGAGVSFVVKQQRACGGGWLCLLDAKQQDGRSVVTAAEQTRGRDFVSSRWVVGGVSGCVANWCRARWRGCWLRSCCVDGEWAR